MRYATGNKILILTLVFAFAGCSLLLSPGNTASEREPLYAGNRPEGSAEPMRRPRAIIVMIADGGGFNQMKAASFFDCGKYPRRLDDRFDTRVAVSTFPEGGSYDTELAWSDFSYPLVNPTDSAAAATALSTGHKTTNGRIATDSAGNALLTVLERAEAIGMMTGIVTTVPLSHATPAAFAAHDASRMNYLAIADQMIFDSGLDVLMGCGNPDFDNDGKEIATARYDYLSRTTWNALKSGTAANDRDGDGTSDPWVLVTERSAITALASAKAFAHVAGIPRAHDTLQERRAGNSGADPFAVPRDEAVPTLSEMTVASLALLSTGTNGFFLVIEGGAIDWANHANQSGRMIEEDIDFERAVETVMNWIDADPSRSDTLLVVTADHESGYLLGAGSGPAATYAIHNRGILMVPDMDWYTTGHTNALVPFRARGPNALHFCNDISGFDSRRGWYIDNAAIGARLLSMLQ